MLVDNIRVTISEDICECSCCGKRDLKRTIHLESEDIGDIYIGVICASRWFKTNLTGNPYYAAAKLERILNAMDDEELEEIIFDIKEASQEW